jgi:hypothetical protein
LRDYPRSGHPARFRRSTSPAARRGTRTNRAPTSDQGWRTVPSRPAPIDRQAVAVDAQHAALDLVGAAVRQGAVGGAEVVRDAAARGACSRELDGYRRALPIAIVFVEAEYSGATVALGTLYVARRARGGCLGRLASHLPEGQSVSIWESPSESVSGSYASSEGSTGPPEGAGDCVPGVAVAWRSGVRYVNCMG